VARKAGRPQPADTGVSRELLARPAHPARTGWQRGYDRALDQADRDAKLINAFDPGQEEFWGFE
jgi:hypothetical protein